ncbi:MAG: hypothetical protein IJ668_05920 [Selenomonadaceae bacterium]|nr:hypothetical protein [Selenomonadaceae bacterium]
MDEKLLELFFSGGLGSTVDGELFRLSFDFLDEEGNPISLEELQSTDFKQEFRDVRQILADVHYELGKHSELVGSVNYLRRELEKRDAQIDEQQARIEELTRQIEQLKTKNAGLSEHVESLIHETELMNQFIDDFFTQLTKD